jgi:hypothetical protein
MPSPAAASFHSRRRTTQVLPAIYPDRPPVTTFAPPIAVEGFRLHLAWHVRRDDDIAVRHVARIIEDLLAGPDMV